MVFAKVPIRYLSKTYKSFIKTWFRRTKSSSLIDDKMRHRNQIHQEPVVDNKSGKNMKGVKKSGLNGDTSSDDDQMPSSRLGCFLCRHRSICNSHSNSIGSTSRNKTTNIKRTNHARSKSMENSVNLMPTPTSSYNSGNSTTPHHMRSRSLSKKKMLSRNGSSCRSGTSIMYSSSSGILKPPPIEKNIECTLEELCYGCTKKIMITRDILIDRDVIQVEELLTINVQPGWKKGTKIKFEGKGNERHNGYSEDIIFYISEKRHELFRRKGDDLELSVEIPLLKALIGCTVSIPLLGGEHMNLAIDDIIYPGYQKIITDQGMPITSASEKRGNLRIKFLVEFPTHLTDNQKSDVFGILQNSC